MSSSNSHTEHFEEMCAAYVLDALDEDERREFEAMMEEAGQKEQEIYHSFQSAANQLAFTVERSEPSAAVKERLMEAIHKEDAGEKIEDTSQPPISKTGSEEESGFSRYAMAVAASIALLLITLALVFYAFNQNATINDQEATITEMKTELEQKEEILSILEARTVDLVVMNGLEVNPDGYGKIIWDTEKQQALLQVSNLPAVPEDKAYQLWLIINNKPVPSATFTVGKQTNEGAFFKVQQMADADKQNTNSFAITLEPEGGSQQPTGDMYLLGNVEQDSN